LDPDQHSYRYQYNVYGSETLVVPVPDTGFVGIFILDQCINEYRYPVPGKNLKIINGTGTVPRRFSSTFSGDMHEEPFSCCIYELFIIRNLANNLG
jgi:hypothetical protein